MIDLNYTFYVQLANFIITLIILNLILIKPIRGILKKRAELMSGRMDEIEKFSADAESKLVNYQAALDDARKQGVEIRAKGKDEGTAEEVKLMEAANADAAETLKQAKDAVAKQVSDAKGALSGDVDKFAQLATEKILGGA